MRTYNIGLFVTSKSSKELQEMVEKYKGNTRCGYSTGKTRAEAVRIIKAHPNEKVVVYCPEIDTYVSEHFMENFLNLEDPLGILMFDEGRTMLSRIDEGLAFKDKILLTNENKIERDVNFIYDEDRFIIGVENSNKTTLPNYFS